MRLRLLRALVVLIAAIAVISLYFNYVYINSSLNSLLGRIQFRSPIIIEQHHHNNVHSPGINTETFVDENESTNFLKEEEEEEADKNDKSDSDIDDRDNLLEIKHNFQCRGFNEATADMNTATLYPMFEFDAPWTAKKGIWKDEFETRWTQQKQNPQRPPLHVIVLPHSHNDPGWLQTFEGYFAQYTKRILDNVIKRLPSLKDMTFMWTEISFLAMWFEQAEEVQKKIFKDLVQEGRIEITTGGYVMTDEAAAHIYAMVDQLIEGHQWVQKNLNVTPKHGWSIDPFGHGGTVPYLLSACDFEGAIIQRIHYNWKELMAKNQFGDFIWKPQWDASNAEQRSLLYHNMPFDMYFVDSSCGPDTNACKPFDFMWFPNIQDSDLQSKADQLIGQYERSASLYPHNVFLAIVGGDFRYNMAMEFDKQYNYKKIIDYVNAHPERYNNATMQFGTPKDYFKIIRERTSNKFPTLAGDLFPYGDIFTDGFPSYWTGYFTTRPFVKIMCRQLEHYLRNSEILFALAFNKINQEKMTELSQELTSSYPSLIKARRNLGLFQHHDAITGTSRVLVMVDYRNRMFDSIKDLMNIQQRGLEILMQESAAKKNFLTSALVHNAPGENPLRVVSNFSQSDAFKYVLFNSLGQERIEIATVRVTQANVKVTDADGNEVSHQVNYLFGRSENGAIVKLDNEFEVIFVARLPALSMATFTVTHIQDGNAAEKIATFEVLDTNDDGEIFIQNTQMRLSIDAGSGLLKSITTAGNLQVIPFAINFGAYKTLERRSGAYLFKADPSQIETSIFILDEVSKIVVQKGAIASYVTVSYGTLLSHTIRLLKTETHLDNGIFVVNHLNIEERHSNKEMFMRIKTSIDNGATEPEFFTDSNGFQWMRRKKVARLGPEASYYPITNSLFIQDKNLRATLITSHSQGATSGNVGELEVMLDRRTPTDDSRGMEQGVTDNAPTIQNFWLTVEFLNDENPNPKKYNVPSLHAHHLTNTLNYPADIYIVSGDAELQIKKKLELLKKPLPCDLNLFNLRTVNDADQSTLPSRSALLIVHKLSYDCSIGVYNNVFYSELCANNEDNFDNIDLFNSARIEEVQRTSLTALKSHGSISSFKADPIEAMELKTFNVTFVQ